MPVKEMFDLSGEKAIVTGAAQGLGEQMVLALVDKVFPKYGKEWSSLTPMGRLGNPSEIKGPALFLASKASSFVTGSVLVMDGGYTIW
jgi:NAD(P)-dependent dehydrogenase (short-subunit alcohol dehydrogenase family)